ncbi:unnamed protein product [Arabidopsis halleri]
MNLCCHLRISPFGRDLLHHTPLSRESAHQTTSF